MDTSPVSPSSNRGPGELLARGRAADVYALDRNRVLRRYRDVAPRDTEREARVMEHVRSHGYPAPVVHDVDGRDLVLERVDGPTLADAITARPWTMANAARTLAALHARLHAIAAPSWLDHAPAGDGDVVVHLDLHPLNVLVGSDGPIVIDWTNAGRGTAAVDVALSWLLLRVAADDDMRPLLRVLARVGRRRFAGAFARSADPKGEARRAGLVAAARYRLSDPNLPEREAPAIHGLVPEA